MIKIGYDAGHALHTPGKRTPDDEREWTFNNRVAKAFANELALYEGVASKRFDDPTGKRDVPLKERTDGANNWGAHYYISFHHNANTAKWGDWTGVETFVYTGNKNTISGQLAKAIHPAVVKAYGLRDRGIKEGNLHIVRETKMPAILIEGGFMDSTIDIRKLRDDSVLENAGKLIAQALAKHLGLKKVVKEVASNSDYRGHWAEKTIQKAIDKGVMNGYPDGTFKPDQPLTRAEFTVILDKLIFLDK